MHLSLAFEMDAALAATQDHAFLKVEGEHSIVTANSAQAPTEGYARTYRTTQRLLEKEISTALTQVNELGAKQLAPEAAEKSLDGLINRLQTLKRKVHWLIESLLQNCQLVEHVQAEDRQLNKCAGRVSHVASSRDTRLERFLVDCALSSLQQQHLTLV